MTKTALLASAVLLASLVSSASAAMIDATNPDAIVNVLRGFGSATLDKDGVGDPLIKGRVDGIQYGVLFQSCKDHLNCQSITYTSSWDVDGISPDEIATWNASWRFTRAYLDTTKQPVIQMDVNLHGGVSDENFADTFDWWQTFLKKFNTEVVNKGK